MQKRKDSSVGVIPVHQAATVTLFCLIQDAKGFWGFPKGHMDPGETPEVTARRELLEETGIAAAELDLTHTFSESYEVESHGERLDKTVTYFLAAVPATDNVTPEAFQHEISALQWLPFDQALSLIRTQSKPLLQEAKEYLESKR